MCHRLFLMRLQFLKHYLITLHYISFTLDCITKAGSFMTCVGNKQLRICALVCSPRVLGTLAISWYCVTSLDRLLVSRFIEHLCIPVVACSINGKRKGISLTTHLHGLHLRRPRGIVEVFRVYKI